MNSWVGDIGNAIWAPGPPTPLVMMIGRSEVRRRCCEDENRTTCHFMPHMCRMMFGLSTMRFIILGANVFSGFAINCALYSSKVGGSVGLRSFSYLFLISST